MSERAMRAGIPWLAARAGVLALAAALGACAVGPDFQRPAAPPADHYTAGNDPSATVAASGEAQHFTGGARIAADWWSLFKSPAVDGVIKEAIANNPGLQAAEAALRQSQHELEAGYGIFYPTVTGDFDASRQKFSPQRFGQSTSGSIFNLFSLSATVSYALDIWGGERRTVEALGAEQDVQLNLERGTYLALSANVVNALVARAAYAAEVDATLQLIGFETDQVHLAEAQVEAGTVPYSTVLSLKSQLATTQATIPALQQNLSRTDDLLATLAGRTPAEWQSPEVSFAELTLPRDLPVSLPSELVRQRPDILAAEAAAHAASANIGVATAALLPSVTLSGSYGFSSNAGNQLFSAGSKVWSFGADAAATLFDGGTLWEKRKAAIDSYDAAMAQYRQTVLAAFAQVADSLRGLEHDAAALAAEDEALATAEQALHLVQANYAAGLANYTDVLIADAQYYQARINDIQAVAVRYQDTVALFTALGGGWWNAAAKQAAK